MLVTFSPVGVAIEEVQVRARKPVNDAGENLHGYSSVLQIDRHPAPVGSVSALVEQQPGIAFAGQGGLFQTVSIRGVSRHRAGNYYLDIPLTTERRAGTGPGNEASLSWGGSGVDNAQSLRLTGEQAYLGISHQSPNSAETPTCSLEAEVEQVDCAAFSNRKCVEDVTAFAPFVATSLGFPGPVVNGINTWLSGGDEIPTEAFVARHLE